MIKEIIDLPFGAKILVMERFEDDRGYFQESMHLKDLQYRIGQSFTPVVRNVSVSHNGVFRGLHAQRNKPQGKLVQVLQGQILDVFVDGRKGSPTYGQVASARLKGGAPVSLWVPPGLLHGFFVESNVAVVNYECTEDYNKDSETGVSVFSKELNIELPKTPIMSARDKAFPLFKDWEPIEL